MADTVSKSWFCVFNNPEEHGYDGTPEEICERFADTWMESHPAGACAVTYCISADELKHLHAVLEDSKAMRFSAVKKVFPSMHIESTKGNKEQAEDYILKRGKFEEKGEKIVHYVQRGEIKGQQGQRRDLDIIDDLIDKGMKPREIMMMNIGWRRYDKMIRDAFYDKKFKDSPFCRDVVVEWHVGKSGTGKTFYIGSVIDEVGEDDVYMVSDYDVGYLDRYCGEPVLVLDEFKGQIRYSSLLSMLQGYKQQFHARYTNVYGLWTRVIITSVFPPEQLYQKMVDSSRNVDTFEQLRRRINKVVYHYKDEEGYHTYEQSMFEYKDYERLVYLAEADEDGFIQIGRQRTIFDRQ